MRTLHYFFLLLGFTFLLSCASPPPNMDGHWHFVVDKEKSHGLYHTLDMKDTSGYLNEMWWGYGYPDIIIESDRKVIRYAGSYPEISFRYNLLKDTLHLTDSTTNERYRAFRADSCQLWPDLAFNNPIRPILPVIERGEGEWLQQRSLTNNIYIGYDAQLGTDLSNPILSNGYEYLTIDDIPENIAKHKLRVPEQLRPRIVMNFYADHRTPISLIQQLVSIAKDNGINKSYISYRASANVKSEVYQIRIDTIEFLGSERVRDLDTEIILDTLDAPEVNAIAEQPELLVTQQMLRGMWTENLNGNANFTILGDTIYYFEGGTAPYSLEGDIQHIDIDGIVFSLKILQADSMLVRIDESGDTIVHYLRMK